MNVAIEVMEMEAKLSMNSKDFDSKLTDAESKSRSFASKLGSGLTKAAAIGGAAVGAMATGVGALGSLAVKSYADYEQLVGGVDTLFKDSSKKVQEYAENAYKSAGMSANEYMETVTSFSASLLQGLKGDTDKAADYADKALVDMSDNANKMGSDMESIQNAYQGFAKQNYTMLDNLKLGYGGTASEMARLVKDSGVLGKAGDDLTAKNLNQKVSFDQIIEAIHVTQERMGIAGTTIKEGTETISGSISTLKGAWENLLAGFGNKDADLGELFDNLAKSASTALGNIMPVVEQAINGISTAIEQLGPTIGQKLPEIMSNTLPSLLSAGASLLGALGQGIIDNAPMLLNSFIKIVNMAVKGIAKSGPKLIQGGVKLIKMLAEGITKALPELIPTVAEIITSLLQEFVNALPDLISAGYDIIVSLAEGLTNAIPVIVDAIPGLIDGLLSAITEAGNIERVIQAGVTLFTSLIEALPTIISNIVAKIPDIITGIVDAITKNLPVIVQAGIDLFTSLITNLPQIIFEIVKAIPQIILSLVSALIKSIPQIIEAGLKLLGGIGTAIVKFVVSIPKKVGKIISKLIEILKDPKKLVEAGKALFNGLWDGIKSIAKKIEDWAPQWAKDLGKLLQEPLSWLGIGKSESDAQKDIEENRKRLAKQYGYYYDEKTGQIDYNRNNSGAPIKARKSAAPDVIRNAATRDLGAPTNSDKALSQNDFDDGINRLVDAINKSGNTTIQLNNREVGRMVRKYA